MTGPEDPSYYVARGVMQVGECEMRASFARLYQSSKEHTKSAIIDRLVDSAAASMERERQPVDMLAEWDYLTAATVDWQREPTMMERRYTQTLVDLIDGQDQDMTVAQWRSQQQARELTGRGRWKTMRDPFGAEATRSRPYSIIDPMSPSHYLAKEGTTEEERVMRADFAHVHHLRKKRHQAQIDSDHLQITEHMFEIAQPWATREDLLGQQWRAMRTITTGTYRNYDDFADEVEKVMGATDDLVSLRSIKQARELLKIRRPSVSADAGGSIDPTLSAAFAAARAARTAELAQPDSRRNSTTQRRL